MRTFAFILGVVLFGGLTTISFAAPLDFNRDIRPILSDTCFRCHGPDAKKQEAGLRLDDRAHAIKATESGAVAIVPKDLAASELVKRISSTDKDALMPPLSSGKKLTAGQIELLKRWISEGAEYQGHWSFQSVQRPEPATVKNPAWCRTPIDRFILARLEREGLSPQVEADRETLIRRVSLDLTGLPPTLAEIDAFVADKSPEAYEKVVDRLLQSPNYGERMALPWLDLARYADSNGFQTDSSRGMWPWREWVIDAFNANKPFDQFTIEQLAGDMLPNATREQIVATGFNRNHRINGEGGRIVEEWFAENVIDRVETTGLTWMGLTFNCCRCHDHKYDPITQKEFYQMFAFFNSIEESGVIDNEGSPNRNRTGGNQKPTITVVTKEYQAELAKLETAVKAAQAEVAAAEKKLPELIAAWEPQFRVANKDKKEQANPWQTLAPEEVKSQKGATMKKMEDGSYLATENNPANDVYQVVAPLEEGTLSGLLIEVFPDPSLPNQSLGRATNGNFVLTSVEAEIAAPEQKSPMKLAFTKAEADFEQEGWPVKSMLGDGKKKPAGNKGWAIAGNDPEKRLPRKAMFVSAKGATVPKGAKLTVYLRHESTFGDHNVGRFRISASGAPPEKLTLGSGGGKSPAGLAKILEKPTAERTATELAAVQKYFRANVDNPARAANQKLAAAQKERADYEKDMPTSMVMKEIAKPREARILNRGEYDRPGDKVARGVPAFLPKLPEKVPVDRLALARWLVAPDHPLTARVWVNRTWEKYFGLGLVPTTENLGSQAEFPSHPELLDWLAAEFMQPTVSPGIGDKPAQAWDMKSFQKLVVMSATYRQSAKVSPAALKGDPENRLLSRGPRFRLSAEIVRDQALAVSGLLVNKLGGPSVRPYMPDGVWDETSVYGDLRGYKADTGEGLYRRTMYTVWKRTAAPPSQLIFDAPNREICTVKRSRTNTPLQALALLNEVTYVEAAKQLGQRMLKEGGATPAERLTYGFRLATAHRPSAEELKVLVAGYEQDFKKFQADPAAAKKLLAVGQAKPDAELNVSELAAYTLSANVLLNLDRVVTRE